jgi:general stress protein CsbA
MALSSIWLVIALVSLALIFFFLIYTRKIKKRDKLSKMAILAFLLVILGIVLGYNRWIAYGLILAGVILAVIDILKNLKENK